MNHSPAPWRVERDGHNHWGKLEVIGPALSVIGFRVATDVTAQDAMRKDADAALIAAAPDLLEALRRLMILNCPLTGNPSTETLLRHWEYEKAEGNGAAKYYLFALVALAKATGEAAEN